jgi:acyl-CoA synthetase (AMP-forming)/AMP-acid ligase II
MQFDNSNPLANALQGLSSAYTRIDQCLDYWAETTPEALAGICGDDKITYAKLREKVETAAINIAAQGAKDGDTIAVSVPPSIEFLILFLAFSKLGVKWLGLNTKYTTSEIWYVLDDAQPALVISDENLTVTNDPTRASPKLVTIDSVINGKCAPKNGILASAPSNQIACLVYTSGTTGKPKAAQLGHIALLRGAQVRASIWKVAPFITINNVPINHVGALGDICCTALVAGGCQVFIEKFTSSATLEAIDKHKVTYWYQAPTMFEMCMNDPKAGLIDWSNLQAAIWSGGRASAGLIEKLSKVAKNLGVDYSMTESVGAVSLSPLTRDMALLGNTVGYPDPSRTLRIADPSSGALVEEGHEGEVQINDESMFLGYVDDAANAGAFTSDGWFKTGDLVVQNADGSWRISGRCKEMFKSGGYNVYPREIELALEAHQGVSEAAIVEVTNVLYGEVGVGFVVLKNSQTSIDSLKTHCQELLANYKIPKHFVILDNMPMLPIGKIDKGELRQMAKQFSQ